MEKVVNQEKESGLLKKLWRGIALIAIGIGAFFSADLFIGGAVDLASEKPMEDTWKDIKKVINKYRTILTGREYA